MSKTTQNAAEEPRQASHPRAHIALGAVLLAYLGLALGYNAVTRLNYAPDEPWHYKYVESIALRGRLPSLTETHQAQHPPLYYALAALWYRVGAIALREPALEHWVRFLSTVMGIATLLLIFRMAQQFFPSRALPQVTTVAAAAFLPLFTYLSAVVNNDALNILLFTATLLLLVRGCLEGFTVRRALWLGVLSGLGLLTKESALAAVALCLIVIFWDGRARRASPALIAKQLAVYVLSAALICAWWFARNRWLFGSFFIHATAKEAQRDLAGVLATFMAQPGLLAWTLRQTLHRSLMSAFAPFWIVRGFLPLSIWLWSCATWVVVVGAGLAIARALRTGAPSRERGRAGWALALAGLLLALGTLRYVLLVDYTAMEGGRYLLPAIGGMALAFVTGIAGYAGRSSKAQAALWVLLPILFFAADAFFLRVTYLFYALGIG